MFKASWEYVGIKSGLAHRVIMRGCAWTLRIVEIYLIDNLKGVSTFPSPAPSAPPSFYMNVFTDKINMRLTGRGKTSPRLDL